MNIVLGGDDATFSQSIDRAQKQLNKLKGVAESVGVETSAHFGRAARGADQFSHATVTSVQAASGALRELNGDFVNNIRAVERFITTIPGAGAALKAAFPVVGGLAFGAMIVEMGMKVEAFVKQLNEAPRAVNQSFAALSLQQSTATDELVLSTDKMQDFIAKIEHKPQNSAKIAIDEARLATDRFAESITSTNAKLTELLSKNSISSIGLLFGKPGTANREGTAKAFARQADDNAYDLANAAPGSPQEAMARKDLKDTQDAQLREARQDLAKRQANVKDSDGLPETANINIDKGIITAILNQQKQEAAQIENAKVSAQKEAADNRKTLTEQARADELKANAARLKADETHLVEVQRQTHQYSLVELANYWSEMASTFRVGSEAYHQVVEKEGQIEREITQSRKQFMAQWKKERADSELELPKLLNSNAETMRKGAVKDAGETGQDYLSSNQLAIEQARNIAREREAMLNTQAGRTMTVYAAAVELANVHAQEFLTTQVALLGIVDTRQAMVNTDPSKENKAQLAKAQRDLETERSRRGIQIDADDGAIHGLPSSALVGASDAMRDVIRAVTDSSAEMKRFTEQGLRGFNEAVLHLMTGGRGGGFKDFGSNLFKSGAGSVLQNVEGHGMQALGLGNGSSAKFLQKHQGSNWGKILSGVLGVGAGALTGSGGLATLLGMAGKGVVSGQGADSGLTSLIPMMDALPHFAAGGAIDAGTAAIIGEKGPEMFIPQSAGTIVPNHQLSSGRGGTGGAYYDFSGANFGGADAGQIEARFSRMLKEVHGSAVKASVKAVDEMNKRRPR